MLCEAALYYSHNCYTFSKKTCNKIQPCKYMNYKGKISLIYIILPVTHKKKYNTYFKNNFFFSVFSIEKKFLHRSSLYLPKTCNTVTGVFSVHQVIDMIHVFLGFLLHITKPKTCNKQVRYKLG